MELAFIMLLKKYYHLLCLLDTEGLLGEPLMSFEDMTAYYRLRSNNYWYVTLRTGQLDVRVTGDYNHAPVYIMESTISDDRQTLNQYIGEIYNASKNPVFKNKLLKEMKIFHMAGIAAVDKKYKVLKLQLYPYDERIITTTTLGIE
jgi:hypothetical protein